MHERIITPPTTMSGTLGNPDDLLFVPLGGSGEIGMNMNLYRYKGRWLIVDMGVMFGTDGLPMGVDTVMPDPVFIEQRAQDVDGLVITHAHDDHIGAIAKLWPRIKCPIYCTQFAANMIRSRLGELQGEVDIRVIKPKKEFEVGPFQLMFQPMTHSIPEAQAIVIKTEYGNILHTGDWKFDDNPLVGPSADYEGLKKIGDDGVLVVVGDSTNAMVEGTSGSESKVRDSLQHLLQTTPIKGQIAIALFSSNIARIQSIGEIGRAIDRTVAIVGRSMMANYEIAQDSGYLKRVSGGKNGKFLYPAQLVKETTPNQRLLLCTGCQAEQFSALQRIADGSHPQFKFGADDVVIFSSRPIPGNEGECNRLYNKLREINVSLIFDGPSTLTHVSGHPNRDELRRLYGLVRPKGIIPVHGEYRHLEEHIKLAVNECGVKESFLPSNGAVVRLAPGPMEKIGEVQSGHLVLDGNQLRPLTSLAVKKRESLLTDGICLVSCVLDADNQLVGLPSISVPGLLEDMDPAAHIKHLDDLAKTVQGIINSMPASNRKKFPLTKRLQKAITDITEVRWGKAPTVEVHVHKLA